MEERKECEKNKKLPDHFYGPRSVLSWVGCLNVAVFKPIPPRAYKRVEHHSIIQDFDEESI